MARTTAIAAAKEHVLLAVMAGLGGPDDAESVPVGERIEKRARATYLPAVRVEHEPGLFDRLKAALAA